MEYADQIWLLVPLVFVDYDYVLLLIFGNCSGCLSATRFFVNLPFAGAI